MRCHTCGGKTTVKDSRGDGTSYDPAGLLALVPNNCSGDAWRIRTRACSACDLQFNTVEIRIEKLAELTGDKIDEADEE